MTPEEQQVIASLQREYMLEMFISDRGDHRSVLAWLHRFQEPKHGFVCDVGSRLWNRHAAAIRNRGKE